MDVAKYYTGEGALSCSYNCSPNVFEFISIFFITFHPVILEPVNHPVLLDDGIFVFGNIQEVSDGFSSFKVHVYSMFSHTFLKLSLRLLLCGAIICVPSWKMVWCLFVS